MQIQGNNKRKMRLFRNEGLLKYANVKEGGDRN